MSANILIQAVIQSAITGIALLCAYKLGLRDGQLKELQSWLRWDDSVLGWIRDSRRYRLLRAGGVDLAPGDREGDGCVNVVRGLTFDMPREITGVELDSTLDAALDAAEAEAASAHKDGPR